MPYFCFANSGRTDAAIGAADVIYGGAGDDWMFGGQGNDKLWGDDATEAELGGQYHGSSNALVKGWVANETAWKEAA